MSFTEPPLDRIHEKAPGNIRLVTFNINGFRTIFHYHPWNKLRTLSNMFTSLRADVITLQELKVTSKDVNNSIGKIDGYSSFITVPSLKKGYSGVGVYVRVPKDDEQESIKASLKVIKAEEGLTGLLKSHDTKLPYRFSDDNIGGYPDFDPNILESIDNEGRSIVLEFSNGVVVISVYCPANSMGTEEGQQFRVQFIEALLARIRNLKRMGKHVILMGDINISRDLIDSADGISEYSKSKMLTSTERDEDFEKINHKQALEFTRSTIPRILLNEILIDSLDSDRPTTQERILVDTVRLIQGRKRGLYTVWNTIRNSRPGNYGSRIDLILATDPLSRTCSNANIWPFLMGSDHCPVFSDFDVSSLTYDPKLLNTNLPKLEAKYAYNLFTGSIDMMFNMGKRKESPSSSQTSISSQEFKKPKTKEPGSVQSMKAKRSSNNPSKGQNTISSFFTASQNKKTNNTIDIESADYEKLKTDSPHTSKEGSSTLKILNGRFSLPTEIVPSCKHNDPCILKTARTQENKGKKFWTCAKDAGTATCPEDESKYSCGFFQWK